MKPRSQETSKKFIEFLAVTLSFSIIWDCCDGWRLNKVVEIPRLVASGVIQTVDMQLAQDTTVQMAPEPVLREEPAPKTKTVALKTVRRRSPAKLLHQVVKNNQVDLQIAFDKKDDPTAIAVAFKVNLPNFKKNLLFDYELPEKTQERMRTLKYHPVELPVAVPVVETIAVEKTMVSAPVETKPAEPVTAEPTFIDMPAPVVVKDSETFDQPAPQPPCHDAEPPAEEPAEPVVAEEQAPTDAVNPDEPQFYGPVVPVEPLYTESPQR
ncbi:MAG: hypothetical protein K1Y36_15190 [Blastocatellia bacterium]|nr:hypothetical protein [Blastocatellia bacterium]